MYCMPNMCKRIIENQVSHWKVLIQTSNHWKDKVQWLLILIRFYEITLHMYFFTITNFNYITYLLFLD